VDLTPLTSWTRTLNEEDALALLLDARPGEPLAAWAERAHDLLPQPGRDRRNETIRMVRAALLDHEGDHIRDSAYLRLLRQGTAAQQRDLLFGRSFFENPWILRACEQLIHPALALAERPLPPHDARLISSDVWQGFLTSHLKPDTGAQSIPKTRAQIQRGLSRLGVLDLTTFSAQRAEPTRLAFGWLVAWELIQTRQAEIPLAQATRRSRAALLFAPQPAWAEQCLLASVDAGLLRLTHLVGEARLHPGAL